MNSKIFIGTSIFLLLVFKVKGPPVLPEEHKSETDKNDVNDPLNSLEYHRYLREVVSVLETDEQFKKMIETASADDIKSGKIAMHLDLVNHNVRSQLDEIKRREVERLSVLISRKVKLNQIKDKRDIEDMLPKHIDHKNMKTFEKSDLEKLITEASTQLEELDRKRKEEFKEHELQKEFERRRKLEQLDEETRKKVEKEYQQKLESEKNHARINHPGSQDQLEEVWVKEDKLEENDFDPKTFFSLHDTDGNGYLNYFEVEALFKTELDKIFNSSDPNVDAIEREQEMLRMREHVMKEVDADKDGNISYDEFIAATKSKSFDNNEEWKSIKDEPQFNENEFKEYSISHAGIESTTSKPQQS